MGAFDSYALWLLLGLMLLISEFFIPGLIAAFFGIGALLVGLLTLVGAIDSQAAQLSMFAITSILSLLVLRRHFARWLKGGEVAVADGDQDDAGLLGMRVQVLTDFVHGAGRVHLNGAKWDAESNDPLKTDDAAWVTGHTGIVLQVSSMPHSKNN